MMFLYVVSKLTGFLFKTIAIHLDSFDHGIVNPATLLITRFINAFQFIQNGKVQVNVIYGRIFILAIFFGTVLNICH
jgi:hypothetical protein